MSRSDDVRSRSLPTMGLTLQHARARTSMSASTAESRGALKLIENLYGTIAANVRERL